MPTPSQEFRQPLTPAQVEEWIHHAVLKRWQLQLNATDSSRSTLAQAFAGMAELCLDAIEEVRVVSAQLSDESQAARFRSAELVAESARLLAQYTELTESQLLKIFKGDIPHGETH